MVKTIYRAASMVIPRAELVETAKRFLVNSGSCKDVVLADNIRSPKFGSSDLLFVNSTKTNLTAARLNHRNNGEGCEKFIISSISYYFWVRQFITVSEVFLNGTCGLEMYLFSDDFSTPVRYLMDNLPNKSVFHLVQYSVLQGEDFDEPAIYFQPASFQDPPQESAIKNDDLQEDSHVSEHSMAAGPVEISPHEFSVFNRLKELYLG